MNTTGHIDRNSAAGSGSSTKVVGPAYISGSSLKPPRPPRNAPGVIDLTRSGNFIERSQTALEDFSRQAAYTAFLEAAKAEYDANINSLGVQLTAFQYLEMTPAEKHEKVLAILAQLQVRFKSPTYAEFLDAKKKQSITSSSSLNSTRAPSPDVDSMDLDLEALRDTVEFDGVDGEEI